jgi:hypothetical protein
MTDQAQGVQYGYVIPKRWGKIDIKKEVDGEVRVYLRRWYLWRAKHFSIRLHHIFLPDQDPDPHDHPWWFLAIIIPFLGGYDETWYRHHPGPTGGWKVRYRKVGLFSFHRAHDAHRIRELRRAKGSWSLFITGAEKNKWGFITPTGKMRWQEYAAQGTIRGPGASDMGA